MPGRIKKILIANRGEIAVRVIRACRDMRIQSVAVYSDADRRALHVQSADEAYRIGPSPSRDSYLVQEKLLAIAAQTGADAVHPGYGFLAENGDFAARVADAGLIFIGPPASAIKMMGDKTVARQAMLKAGVPIVPGTDEPLDSADAAAKTAQNLGYPVLLKAAAGGGGKGMRIVKSEKEIAAALRAARSEAESAFGDGRVYVEKYLENPRHIEFQILADMHGNTIHLGERECSIQRRHQKIIEEAPSVLLDDDLRAKMGEAAVQAAAACGYVNAGTIEFMVDKNRDFYFLEMNTRLQVEHPVTEMIAGLDLVRQQILIAEGNKLPLKQEDVTVRGHAIECRIYAEDALNNFMPSNGTIRVLRPPSGPGIRDDGGYRAGNEVSLFYDSLISKLVAWGSDREEALARMARALDEYQIAGVETSIPFCKLVIQHPEFVAGKFDTHFLEKEFLGKDLAAKLISDDREIAAAIAAAMVHSKNKKSSVLTTKSGNAASRWKLAGKLSDFRY